MLLFEEMRKIYIAKYNNTAKAYNLIETEEKLYLNSTLCGIPSIKSYPFLAPLCLWTFYFFLFLLRPFVFISTVRSIIR